MLTAVEVLVVFIIKYLILDGGGCSDASVSFGVMAFLADNVQSGSIQNCESFAALLILIEKYVKDDRLQQYLKNLKSMTIEDMFALNDSVRSMFNQDANVSLNRLSGPIRITQKSFLGIIIRSFLARWESLSFEDACLLVEKLTIFVSQDCTESPCSSGSRPVSHYSNSNSVTEIASRALENGDIAVTEDAIHSYFDCSDVDPLSNNPALKLRALAQELSTIGRTAPPQQFNKSTVVSPTSSSSSSSSVGRHQMAMLGLATMWSTSLPVGNVHLALSAVEEAMKTAHQRGDHASVARALLLMYHVVHSSHRRSGNGSAELTTSTAHDILLRCIARCIQLKLNNLVCEALTLLAQLRSGGGLRWASLTSDDDLALVNSGSVWSASDNWSLLQVSLLGVPSLIARQLSSSRDQDANGGSSKKPISVVLTAQQKKDLSADSPACMTPNLISLNLRATNVSHGIWTRLGMLHAADLSCRQAAKQYVLFASRQECAGLCERWVKTKVDLINLRLCSSVSPSNTESLYFGMNTSGSSTVCPYAGVIQWVGKIQAFLCSKTRASATNHHWYRTLVLKSLLYARIHQCAYHGQWDKAVRLAYEYVDTSAQGYQTGESDAETSGVGQSSVTESWLEAKLLLAKLVCQCGGYSAGQELLIDLINVSGSCGFHAVCLDASLVRYTTMYRWDSRMRSTALAQVKSLMAQTFTQSYSSLTVLLSRF